MVEGGTEIEIFCSSRVISINALSSIEFLRSLRTGDWRSKGFENAPDYAMGGGQVHPKSKREEKKMQPAKAYFYFRHFWG